MNKTRRKNLLKKLEQVTMMAHVTWGGATYLASIETRIVSEFPDYELPLLIGNLNTEMANKMLEKRLKKE